MILENWQKTTNKEFKNIGDINGVSPRGCIAIGRTLTYQYNVPEKLGSTPKFKKMT